MLTPFLKSSDSAGFDAREGAPTSGIEHTTAMTGTHRHRRPLKTEYEENPLFNARLRAPRHQQEQEPCETRPFRVQADRFDHEIEFIGAVDLARYAIGHPGPDELGFGEVIAPIDPLRIAVAHEGGHLLRSRFAAADGNVVGLH